MSSPILRRFIRRFLPKDLLEAPRIETTRTVPLSIDGRSLYFQVCSDVEVGRVNSFFIKEPGTLEWLRTEVMPGQRFCDIGANIGIYAMYGGMLVGTRGRVYAFEPHLPNCASLLGNVSVNKFEGRFDVFSCALNDRSGFFDFECSSLVAGSSLNQLYAQPDSAESPSSDASKAREKKYSTSLDALIRDGVIEPPHHIKIDVDGNELLIVRGMKELLTGAAKPISLQVEVDPAYSREIKAFLDQCGYTQVSRNFTHAGQIAVDGGADPETVTHNVIFKPKAS